MASQAASDALGDPTTDDAPTKKRKIEIVDEPVDDGDEYVPEAPAIGDEWVERWAAARNKNTPATEPPESTQPAEDAPAPEIAAAPTPAPAASDAATTQALPAACAAAFAAAFATPAAAPTAAAPTAAAPTAAAKPSARRKAKHTALDAQAERLCALLDTGREDAQTQASLCSKYMQTLMRASERVSNYTKRAESQSPLALHARACKHFARLDLLEPAWTGGGELCKRPERQTHLSSRDDLHCMSSSRNCGWRERSNAASDTLVGPVRVVPARRSRLRAAHAPPRFLSLRTQRIVRLSCLGPARVHALFGLSECASCL